MADRVKLETPPAAGDVLVWELSLPAGAIGVVAAIGDGYEGALQLRAVEGGAPGDYMAWVAPAFVSEVEALLVHFAERFGVRVVGPRPFGPGDLAAGIHTRRRPGE